MLTRATCGGLAVVLGTALLHCGEAPPPAVGAPDVAIAAPPMAPAAVDPGEEFLAIARALEQSDALFIGGSREQDLRQRLVSIPAEHPQAVETRVLLARELMRLGDPETALAELRRALVQEDALWQAGTAPGFGAGDSLRSVARHKKLLLQLVLASVRLGEQVNCIHSHAPASCILPIVEGGIHRDRIGAQTAMGYALQYLQLAPDDLTAMWFLNLAAMQAGQYPQGVPVAYRIDPLRFATPAPVARFHDIAGGLGVATFDLAGGSVVDDLDNDGYYDIVTSSMDPRQSLSYLHNEADGTFANRTAGSGLDEQLGGLNLIHTDYDDDGRIDLLVLRGGWMQNLGGIRNSLLHNEGTGRFVDVTHKAGLAEPAQPTQTGAWADYDGDGDLDLFVGNEGEKRGARMHLFADNLFRNEGDGSFVDVAATEGLVDGGYAKGSAWGDYDADGDPDLYVSNIGPNRLYRNDTDGFTDVAPLLEVTEPAERSFATWFFDHDNDGDLDLFVVSYLARVEDVAADLMGQATPAALWPHLYRNDDGRFTNVTQSAGLNHPSLPMGANFGDIDEDGFLDIYLGTGSPSFESQMPNVMYRNRGDGSFEDVTYAAGFGHLQKGHGISFADFDHDGDTDVALQAGGMYPGDRFRNALFENPGHGRRFLSVKAVGSTSNKAAVGTRIHVRVATAQGERSIYRWVGTGGSFGGSPLEQFIGLGEADEIVALELDWPDGHTRQRFTDVPLDAAVRIVEGESSLHLVQRTPLTWSLAHDPDTQDPDTQDPDTHETTH